MQLPVLAHAAVGVSVVTAGTLQFTSWKIYHLACCQNAPAHALPGDFVTAWRHGLRLGFHCSLCCINLMAMFLVVGVMDLRAMTIVVAAHRR